MKHIVYCLFVSSICIYATCNKRIDCKQITFSFEGYYKAYPDHDSVLINDTIWLESQFPTHLNDLIRNRIVDYSGAENLGMAMSYLELVGGNFSDPGVNPSAGSFDNILIKGIQLQSLNPEQTKAFRFIEENGFYRFKLGIISRRKGVFIIGPGNAASVYRRSNKCDKASFNLIFSNTNQHLYLYEQSRPGYVLSSYEKEHLYAFKVY